MKEIIIDGVDVSECYGKTPYKNDYGQVQCKCFRFLSDDNETYLLGICEQHPYCHYKQLKRKEKECEELKNCDKTLIYKQARNNFEKLNKYKQALQEIKDKVEYLQRFQSEYDYVDLNCILQIISEVEE